MKKRLEAELISIAHRILKLKNKSEVDQLHKETQKLYETLTVLKFYQDNFEAVKSEISEDVLEEKLEQPTVVELSPEPKAEEKDDVVEAGADAEPEVIKEAEEVEEEAEETQVSEEPEAAVEEELEEEVDITVEEEPEAEEQVSEETELETEVNETEEAEQTTADDTQDEEELNEDKPAFEPIFELEAEAEEEQTEETIPEEKLEDHIGKYADPVFVKPDSLFPAETPAETREEIRTALPTETPKTAALNDAMSKSIAIGLNDRIGFVQHLFNDSNEDFNRVISQLNTFDTFEEAKTFINEMVIPDYNYWVGEEDYIERFMAIVEKKFQ